MLTGAAEAVPSARRQLARPRWRFGAAAVIVVAVAHLAYVAALAWHGPSLGYDLHPLYLAGSAVIAGRQLFQLAGFVYAPSAALFLGGPLSQFPWEVVRSVALVAGPLLVVATVFLAARTVRASLLGAVTALGVAIASLSSTVDEVLQLENLSLLLGLLTAAAFLAWSRGRDGLAGALLGCTLAVKPVLLPLWVGLVVLRRWRAFAAATAVPVVLNLVALAVDPAALDGWRALLDQYFGHSGLYGGFFILFNASITNVSSLLGWWGSIAAALRIAVVASAVVGAVTIWRTRPEPFRALEAGGLLVAGFWLSSQVMESHWLLMLVPFAFAGVDRVSPVRAWPVALGGVFAAWLVVVPGAWTRYGAYGAASMALCLGLCLVVFTTTAVSLHPRLTGRRGPPARVLERR
jgi:arabinofuranan 3-O-arabinosyltransferase